MDGKKFDAISATEIVDSVTAGLERADNQQALIGSFARREFIRAPGHYGEPFSFIAPAETGATLGVVEVLGQTADRQGVRIRYRTVGWYTAVVERSIVNRNIAQGSKARWEITDVGNGTGEPEVIELHGELKAESTSGGNYKAATVHVGGQPLFMIVGEGYMGGSFTWQSTGTDSHGNLGDISFAFSNENKAIIDNRSYDLTQGRVFFVRPDGTLRQIAARPESVLSGDGLKNFVAGLPPEGKTGAAVAARPAEPADRDAWREKLPQEMREKLSSSDMGSLLRELGYAEPHELKDGRKPAKIELWGNDFSNFDEDETKDWVIQVQSLDSRGRKISGTLIYDLMEHGWTCIAKVPGIFPVGWNHEFEGRKGFYTQESIPGEPPINQRERYYRWDGNRYIEDRVEYARGG